MLILKLLNDRALIFLLKIFLRYNLETFYLTIKEGICMFIHTKIYMKYFQIRLVLMFYPCFHFSSFSGFLVEVYQRDKWGIALMNPFSIMYVKINVKVNFCG